MTAQWLAESGGSGTSLPDPSSDSPVWGGKSSSGLEETEQSDSLVCVSTSFVQVGCWLAALVELLVFPALGAADDAALFQSGLTKETVAHFLFLSISGRNHTHTHTSFNSRVFVPQARPKVEQARGTQMTCSFNRCRCPTLSPFLRLRALNL